MSLLDDARQIEQRMNPGCQGQGRCIFCYRLLDSYPAAGVEAEGHAPDCAWLSTPMIVQALEAADRVARVDFMLLMEWCPFCDGHQHARDCPWQALVAALKGAQ